MEICAGHGWELGMTDGVGKAGRREQRTEEGVGHFGLKC